MKISQLSTDEVLDLFCEITPYVSNIVSDPDIMEAIGKAAAKDGITMTGMLIAGTERLTKVIPILLKTHRADVYGVIAAVNKMEVSEIASQNVLKTAVQIREILKDRELNAFFKSFAEQEESA